MIGKGESTLFRKYFSRIFFAVMLPLLALAAADAAFAFRERREATHAILRSEAASASGKVQSFLSDLRDNLSTTVEEPWAETSLEQHYLEAIEFLRRNDAATSIQLTDADGREQVYVSRSEFNRLGSGVDLESDQAVKAARDGGFWYGDMEYSATSQPMMRLAVAGVRRYAGIAIAEIDLKKIRDVIADIRIGNTGHAMIANTSSQLIAHSDLLRVLSGGVYFAEMRAFMEAFDRPNEIVSTTDLDGARVIATMADPVADANWRIFVLQSRTEAFEPLFTMLGRSTAVSVLGAGVAAIIAYFLSSRIALPIRKLEEGATRVGAGDFEYRIIESGRDELGRLEHAFNDMAQKLADLQSRAERLAGLKRFLPAQVAELMEQSGTDSALGTQRAEIVAVFCDLRGFTAFTARSEPELIMSILDSYYQAIGAVITRFQATLTNFAADGLMILVNAPIPCPEPASHALRMASEMQETVQGLLDEWNARGCDLGFGIGVAMGWATVGRIGYEGRVDYTAIGGVVNLAARLCAAAGDREILFDRSIAHAVRHAFPVVPCDARELKGFERPVPVFTIEWAA